MRQEGAREEEDTWKVMKYLFVQEEPRCLWNLKLQTETIQECYVAFLKSIMFEFRVYPKLQESWKTV